MARIAIGANVRKGPRRGQVLKHRPQGMVDVQFTDVGWVERHDEKTLHRGNPSGEDDYYDPDREQFRRQQMAIYESQKKRGLSDKEAWESSWAIATGVGQKYGWLKPGTQEPTEKGRRGAKQKLKTDDAWAKRQKYELELGRRRKSGKHRVVPQKHGKQTRYYVQPGGRYFLKKEKAVAERDRLNGVKMKGRKRKVANPGSYYDSRGDSMHRTMHPDVDSPYLVMTYPDSTVFEYKRLKDAQKKAAQLAKTAQEVMVFQDGNLILRYRGNWLPAAAAVLTIADVGYRAVKDRKKKKKKKKKKTENPRYLDERAGMGRGVYGLHSAARAKLAEARVLGRLKGVYSLKLTHVPDSRKAHFVKARRGLENDIENTDEQFKSMLSDVIDQIPGGEYGRRTKTQKNAVRALRGAYDEAYSEVFLERERKKAAKKARRTKNPKKKRTKGIAKSGVGYHWGSVRGPKAFQGMKPTLFREGEVFYLVYEGKSRKIPRVVGEANRAPGLKGRKWRRVKSVTSALWQDVQESASRYSIVHPKSGRGSKSDPYRIYDKEKERFFRKTFTRKTDADKFLWEKQGGTRRDYSVDKPREDQVRSDRFAGDQITAYSTTSLSRAKYIASPETGLTFLDVAPGAFERQKFESRYEVKQTGPYRIHKVTERPPAGDRRRFFPKTYTLVIPGGTAFENRPFKSPGAAVTFALRQTVSEGGGTLRQDLQSLTKAMPRYKKLSEAEATLRSYLHFLRVYDYKVSEESIGKGKDKETWYTVKSGPSGSSYRNVTITPVTLTDRYIDKEGKERTKKRKAFALKAQGTGGGVITLGSGTKAEMEKLKKDVAKGKPSKLPTKAQAQAGIEKRQELIKEAQAPLDRWGTPGRPDFILLAHGSEGGIKFDKEGFDLTGPVAKVTVSLDREPKVEQIWISDAMERKYKARVTKQAEKYQAKLRSYDIQMDAWERLSPRQQKETPEPVRPRRPYVVERKSQTLGHPDLDWTAALYSERHELHRGSKAQLRGQRQARADSELRARPGWSPGSRAPSKRRTQVAQFQEELREMPRARKYVREEQSKRKPRKLTDREKKMAELEKIRAEMAKLRGNPYPYRENYVGAAIRGITAIARSPLGKKIAVEAAVVAGIMAGEKLVKKGKMSPTAMSYIQRRVEQKTGVKPAQSQVTAVLKDLDANKDQDVTDAEIVEAVKLLQKRKK